MVYKQRGVSNLSDTDVLFLWDFVLRPCSVVFGIPPELYHDIRELTLLLESQVPSGEPQRSP